MLLILLSKMMLSSMQPCFDSFRLHQMRYEAEEILACGRVVSEAQSQSADISLMVELAFSESRFRWVTNKSSGCTGPMQVKPRWACPSRKAEGCDLVASGVNAYKTWLRLKKTPELALCHYKSGNVCSGAALGGARRVLKWTKRLKRLSR